MSEQDKREPLKSGGPMAQEKVRKEKMKQLGHRGIDLFPHKVKVTHSIREALEIGEDTGEKELEDKKVRVGTAGRIMSVRKMGRAVFFHLGDSQGRLQAYLRKDHCGEDVFETFSLLDIGDVISVEGQIFRTRTGELTVLVDDLTFLAKCLHPLPEKWHGLRDVELRYRKRHLDLLMNPEEADVFRTRSRMISLIRDFFNQKGYVEVETPMMQAVPGGALARPFATFHKALGIELFLRIAPELYLKRLVVGGLNKVYEINRNFRNEGIDQQHNPEFTMLEFYEAYCDYNDMMSLSEELLVFLTQELFGKDQIDYGDHTLSFKRPWKRIKFMDAIARHSDFSGDDLKSRDLVIAAASEMAEEGSRLSYGKALDVLFDRYVAGNLIQPTFVINPPKEISPLAKASRDNPEEAERFELFIAGMEVANAFSELTNPAEQKMRFEQQAELKKKGDEETHAIDLDYVSALEYGMPPAGGEGIGIDRLAMIFTNRHSIREVILFPLLKPKLNEKA
ncbi:MAG: lysine--tRNA ligase [Candidatus Aminicenantes bacterium]